MISAEDRLAETAAQEEQELLVRARQNRAAFALVYERYFKRIYRYCLRRVEGPEAAEDLTSTVFIRALGSLTSYRGGSAAAWLFTIAHNVVANHLRSRKPQLAGEAGEAELGLLPDESLGALDLVIEDEQRRRVAELISLLPDEQRELLALRVAGELSTREIAAIVGKNEGAVRVALHRIVQRLRTVLEQWEEGELR